MKSGKGNIVCGENKEDTGRSRGSTEEDTEVYEEASE